MPSVLAQKFKNEFVLPSKNYSEVKNYCENEIGYRTYVLSSRIGGKKWYMSTDKYSSSFKIGIEDDGHALYLTLKFAGQ